MTGNLKLLINFVWKFLGTVRFGNDHVAVILGFGDLQWGNILITKVYFVEGLGHNLLSVGQFCDLDLEVTFRRNTCFVRNLKGVDLLKGNCTTNLYTINLHEMVSASPICLMARATSTKSWLWHQRLSHLNFDTINDLAKNNIVTSLPKFKYHKEYLCPSCEQGKSKRASHPPKPDLNSRQRLHILHMDFCGPMRIASINEKRALCYPKNDREDIGKLGAKGDIRFFIGYSVDSCAYRVYNRRTKKIMETMNVTFDELSTMAFEQISSKIGLQSMTSIQISSGLDLSYALSTITTQQPTEGELDLLFKAMYDDYIGGQPSAAPRTVLAAQAPQVLQTPTTSTLISDTAPTPTNSSYQATNFLNTSQDVDGLKTQQQHAQQQGNQAPLQLKTFADNVPYAMFDENTFVNPFATPSISATESSYSQYVDPSNMNQLRSDGNMCMYALTVSTMEPKNVKEAMTDPEWIKSLQEELLQFKRLDVWVLVPTPDNNTPITLKWLFKKKHDEENTVIRNKSRLVVRGRRVRVSPEGFIDADHPSHVYKLKKALYGLKQAPRAWYDELSTFLLQNHFFKGTIDPTLFIRRFNDDILVVQVYVDDIIFGSTHPRMESCDPIGTPMEIKDKFDLDQNETPVDATKYHSMIRALMYLTSNRPDIVHATCLCARYQAKPSEKHLKEVKRIFRYIRRTVNTGLWYMKDFGFELTGFSDADYAGCKDTFKSTSGGVQFLGEKLVSWSSKKQDYTALSTAEAEYVSLSACCAQVLWMRTQLTEYGFYFNKIPIYYDSKSAIALSCNQVQHLRTKHIIVHYHFIKEHVEKGTIELYFVKTDYQLADLFTKAIPLDRFNYLVRRLGARGKGYDCAVFYQDGLPTGRHIHQSSFSRSFQLSSLSPWYAQFIS
nr:hypothetical protein [Tanacetum cinerariifolium]